MHEHGWLDEAEPAVVCPGDWVFTHNRIVYGVMSNEDKEAQYVPYEPDWSPPGDQKLAFSEHPDYGDLFTMEEFIDDCDSGCMTDYDGTGRLATAQQVSNVYVSPSDFEYEGVKAPEWATHVMWFNK
jgi:hypothetical protein